MTKEQNESLMMDLRSFQLDLKAISKQIKDRNEEKKIVELELKEKRKEIAEVERVRIAQIGLIEKQKGEKLVDINTEISRQLLEQKRVIEETTVLVKRAEALRNQISSMEIDSSSIESHMAELILQNASINISIAAGQSRLSDVKKSIEEEGRKLEVASEKVREARRELDSIRDTKILAHKLNEKESAIIKREEILSDKEGQMAANEEKIMFIYKKLLQKTDKDE